MFLTVSNEIKWRKMGWGAVITLAVVLCGIFLFDKPLYILIRKLNCGLWNLFDMLFGAKVWLVSSLVAFVVLCVKKYMKSEFCFRDKANNMSLRRTVREIYSKTKTSNAALIFFSVLTAAVSVKVLKTLIGRARPIFFEALDMTGFYPPSLDWAFNSMPSGHTIVSFAGLVMIGMLAPKYKWFTWSLAILIGFSRIAVGAHWPTDVILGAFLGMAIADIIKWYFLKKE
mgnify:FL=1